jgi:SRSO17 transposase
VLCDKVREEVIASLADPSGVLVVEETGFLKKGAHSVGVARQYSGTAGRVENCQVGVFLAYASPLGRALIDRRLYLPDAWPKEKARCRKAGVPEAVSFASKTEIARGLIGTALYAGVPCAWVLADALYGSDAALRRMLEEPRQPYVLAVRSNLTLRFVTPDGLCQTDPGGLGDVRDDSDWTSHAAEEGTKRIRRYDWTRIALPWPAGDGFERWVWIRRGRKDPDERAYYLVFAPTGTELAELAGAAGLRWTI